MRLAIRFVTSTSRTLRSASRVPSTVSWKPGPISVPRSCPFSRTRALSRTCPRSSRHAVAAAAGRGKTIV